MPHARLDAADRLDIQDLFARYCFLIDENRGDEWAALFARDAVFDVPGLARLEGRAEIRKMVEMVSAQSQGRWRHQLTNIVAEPAGDTESASVRMSGLVTDWSNEGAVSTFSDYSARLRKIDGEWRIVEIVAQPLRITV
jgi:3-phenylpropionate/cinnamic acid dioxygenase small subunit